MEGRQPWFHFRSICSLRGSVVGETLDLIRIETDFPCGEIELMQAGLLHISPERRSGYAENRHGFSGVDQMTADVRLLAASEDAFCVFRRYGGIGLQKSTDCVDGGLCHVSHSFGCWLSWCLQLTIRVDKKRKP